ncbi:MAG: hypothetical protein LH481_11325 [Burkholderiales bacterium]|nr:hypothetical protein [Burkholderiales bacterium]
MQTQTSLLKCIRTTLCGCTVAASLLLGMATHANSVTDPSRASINASIAIPVTLVDGSAQMFKDAGQLSVTGIKTVGNVSVITLRGLANGAEASVQISSKAIEGSAIGVGVVLQATVSATGVLLVSAGKALMFVPNEMGKSLLHHSRARDF